MTNSVTGGRPGDGRRADQTAHRVSRPHTLTLPERAVTVSPGPAQPDEAVMTRSLRHVFRGCRMMFYVVMPLMLLVMVPRDELERFSGLIGELLEAGPASKEDGPLGDVDGE